jgi:hypothetical protein
MITPSEKGGGDERMHLRRCSFRWLCGGIEVIHAALPNAVCPGLHRKPLDAAIGQLLTPYRLGGHQGDRKQNNDVTCTHFDGHFDDHRNAAVLNRAHRPMEEVRGFHKSH